MNARTELPVVSFESQHSWGSWLGKYHETSNGLWLKISKKGSGIDSVSYAEALEVALCYGWIDGQKAAFDEHYWLQQLHTPQAEEQMVEDQPRQSHLPHREGQYETRRTPGSRKSKGRWAVGRRLRIAEQGDGPRRPTASVGVERPCSAIFLHARRYEQVRDPAPHTGRQKAGDAGTTYRKVRGHAGRAREDLPLNVRNLDRLRRVPHAPYNTPGVAMMPELGGLQT